MEENRTDKTVLFKGIKILIFSVLTLFMGPILLSFAYSKPESPYYYPLLIIGCAVCAMAVFMVFKGLKTIMDSMFKK
ncbi:hypothetical protein KO493_13245 [Tamlana agarivorans]|uniref:Uncharacterized protein n=1 Tax=Pseudotamlana agarivorans TaxID=481183 RepID=A0ACC5UBH3_9FLAO|nr:DUF6095 family protein [Tamlana agarivorans]MBU2951666.1 hypothetical protein [Tamlana agarivorans]